MNVFGQNQVYRPVSFRKTAYLKQVRNLIFEKNARTDADTNAPSSCFSDLWELTERINCNKNVIMIHPDDMQQP